MEDISKESAQQKPLRLWPGVVVVSLQWLVMFAIPAIVPGAKGFGVLGGLLCGLVVMVWWAFFSRAPLFERWGALILMTVTMAVTSRLVHESIVTGMRGMMFIVYSLPVLCLSFIIWAAVSLRLSVGLRRAMMVVSTLLACGMCTLVRSDGITGEGGVHFAWRWSETSEERFLAGVGDKPLAHHSTPVSAETEPNWPGFRGPNRDGIIPDISIVTDWSVSSPEELWRRKVGPGCSSFAVHGGLLYTQEQHGEDEVVACYNLSSGEPVWRHKDPARFWDSHAGAGPRSTPTLNNGLVYTFGATGILNALDAIDGSVVWKRNVASDIQSKPPGWGITSSPLVVNDLVIVAFAGELVAFDLATGNLRWIGPDGGTSYSSPHLFTIDEVTQILLMNGVGVTSLNPADGNLLWEHSWPQDDRVVQPALTGNGNILLNTGGTKGLRRISIARGTKGWTLDELWTSVQLRSTFNDFVVHKGYAYGYEGPSLACIDMEDGKRKWKGGRYGGQLLLLADQDVLLVLSEKGELALVEATPEQFRELSRFPAIEGKTWNHPVMVGDVLLVRNSQEMVAFQLSLMSG